MRFFDRLYQPFSFHRDVEQSLSQTAFSWAEQFGQKLDLLSHKLEALASNSPFRSPFRSPAVPSDETPEAPEEMPEAAPPGPGSPVITEYVEGGGYNKAIELTNRGESDQSLEGYRFALYSNANVEANAEIDLSGYGPLAPGETLVLANPRAEAALLSRSDDTSNAINFNGNDAFALIDASGETVDIIGTPGDTAYFARDVTLRRDDAVTEGSAQYLPDQWETFERDNVDDLGEDGTSDSGAGDDTPSAPPGNEGEDMDLPPIEEMPEAAPPEPGSPVITEYVEGGDYNKAIELTNRGESDQSLVGYRFALYSNANVEANAEIDLSAYGPLAPGETLVLANPRAEAAVLSRSDDTSNAINFNGNDALALLGPDGETVDIIGTPGDTDYFARDVTLRRDDTVTEGSAQYLPAQWETFERDNVDDLGEDGTFDNEAGDDTPSAPPGNEGENMDLPPIEVISTIQGSGMQSEMVGERASLEAIVTLDAREGLDGFFLQEEDADRDDDETTSEGIFVYLPNDTDFADFSEGDRVQLAGTVDEYQGKTQMTDITSLEVTGRDQPLPSLTEVTLPIADKSDLAAFESMRVAFNSEDGAPLTVTDTYELGRYGSVTLSSGGRLAQFTEQNAPDQAGHQRWMDQIESRSIILDDASSTQNPEEIIYGRGGEPLSAQNTLRGGDTIDQATGVLDFAFQQWRVQNSDGLDFQPTNPRPEAPDASALGEATLKVASFNVLNYFETLDRSGNQITTPEGTEHSPRGADSETELARQQQKLVDAINQSGADIVGLNEIANDGFGPDSSIARLVSALNESGEANWDWITPRDAEGQIVSPGSDAIAVGLIYQPDSVTPQGEAAVNTSGAFASANRAPVLQTFQDEASGETFSVVVNHFKSKGSVVNGEEAIGDGQGNNNPTRVEAAEQLAAWVETDPTGQGDDDVLIIGDLNSYAMEDPITALENEGYRLLDDDYSYSFNGQWGSLDHALASQSLNDQVTGTTTWHINADEPIALDYNTEYKTPEQVNSLYADGPFRSSDHDPVVVGLNLGAGAAENLF